MIAVALAIVLVVIFVLTVVYPPAAWIAIAGFLVSASLRGRAGRG